MRNNRGFFESKTRSILLFTFLICGGLLMSVSFLYSTLTDPDVKFLSFIPILMVLFCFYLCIHFFKSITNPKPYIVVDSKGIHYNVGFLDVGGTQETFLWSDIKKLCIEDHGFRIRILMLKIILRKKTKLISLRNMTAEEKKNLIDRIEVYKKVEDEGKFIKNSSPDFMSHIIGIILGILLVLLIKALF